MMNHCYAYQIGTTSVEFYTETELTIDEKYLPFSGTEGNGTKVCFRKVKKLPVVLGQDLVTESDVMFSEYNQEGTYIRTFHGTGEKEPYAVLKPVTNQRWECSYLEEFQTTFCSMDACFSHAALERLLIKQRNLILHASFIEVEGSGILFTGVSGIGKSTQAELWEKYENARIVNGDRTILCREGTQWTGYGSPYAGSSRIYRNQKAPLKAIVSLEKYGENSCTRVAPGKAFAVLYAGITLNPWNREFMKTAIDQIQDLCMQVPVFHLKCRADRFAAACLKESLKTLQEEEMCRRDL